jgi:Ni/Fe-hydrogenase subunit HybB-like protein
MTETAKTRQKRSAYILIVLAGVIAVGLGIGIVRLIYGLGATTNLSDAYPWGLWIVYDVFFIPFSAGAFMISLVTHVYHREEYHDIARPVVLAGFAGYTGVVAILLMDLGRWHQFYSVLLPPRWNLHSFMFEVSMCITLYSGVLILEVAPSLLERLKWRVPLDLINSVSVTIAAAGVVLSSLHQSSLGSLFLVMPYKLNPLWWTSLLPLLFFTSAAFGGLSMAILVTVLGFRAFGRSLDQKPLRTLAKIVLFLLGVYLVLKVGDLILNQELALVFSSGGLSVLFVAELVIGVIVPIGVFGVRKVRESETGLIAGSTCVLLGLAINRVNVAFLALDAPAGVTYIPSWMEIVLSLAVVSAGVLIFALAAIFLPVLPGRQKEDAFLTSTLSNRRMMMGVGGGLFALTAAVVLLLQPVARAAKSEAAPPSVPQVVTFAQSQSETCEACHLDEETLIRAGAEESELVRLAVDRPPEAAHTSIGCVTCHWGRGDSDDIDAIHATLLDDPSRGDCEACLGCHHDMPDVFPKDRLQTPHNDLVHGHEVGMHCSDCHGEVAHGFDPMGGDLFCPMDVCLDCHLELGLESEFEDCSVCHVGPHDVTEHCDTCHLSVEVWEEVAYTEHPVALVDQHATAQCFDCHDRPEFAGLRFVCSDCHERPHDFGGDDCAQCHTPADDWGTCLETGRHPFPTDHGDAYCDCTQCHLGGDTSQYWCEVCHRESDIGPVHQAQEINFTEGLCIICHPQGQVP